MVSKPLKTLLLLCLAQLVVLSICLHSVEITPATDATQKQQAVELAIAAHSVLANRLPGPEYSIITTTLGSAQAKQLSLHPDFAAVAVDLLHQAGIRPGDRIALNMSGSFPGLNIAVLAAARALGCEPVIVSSVGASTWGATNPQDTWLDMEHSLIRAGLWPWRSLAASAGGVGDRGGGLDKEGLASIRSAMLRNAVPDLGSTNVSEGISRRLALYRDSSGRLPAALINIGGSHVIFGNRGHAVPLRQGVTIGYRLMPAPADSLAAPFLQANRSIIHFININRLSAKYQITANSRPGTAKVFRVHSLPLAARLLAVTSLFAVTLILWRKRRDSYWKLPPKSTGS